MPSAYWADIRGRVIARADCGASRPEAAEQFEVKPGRRSVGCAAGRGRADVARARRHWLQEQSIFDPARRVFIDETAADTKMEQLSGSCPCGDLVVERMPQGHQKTTTYVAVLRHDEMTAYDERRDNRTGISGSC
jgi:hypothetical protein